jgi:hypothetical protein
MARTDAARRATVVSAVDDHANALLEAYRKRSAWRPVLPPRAHPRLHWQLDAKSYVLFAGRAFYFEDRDEAGRTIAQRFLADEGATLSPLARALLEGAGREPAAVWHLERVVPNEGLEVTHAQTGERRFLSEVRLSEAFAGCEGGAILARVVEVDGISIASSLHLDTLTREAAAGILAQGITDSFALGELWERAVEQGSRPRYSELRDTEGNLIEPTLDRYVFAHETTPKFFEKLLRAPGVECVPICQGAIGFKFYKANAKKSADGSFEGIVLGKGVTALSELVIEASSPARADAICGRVEKACKPHLHHIGRTRTSADDYFDRFMVLRAGPEWLVSTTRDEAELHDIKIGIVDNWVHTPNETLFGRTPMEATQSLRGRCRLRWMLGRLARLEAKVPEPIRFDVENLKRQLHVDDEG